MLISSLLLLATTDLPRLPADLEVVIVTASRQERSAANVPTSVEVIKRGPLDSGGIDSASDIVSLTTAVTEVSIFGSSAPQFYIRGVGSNDVNPSANPGIAVYQNETFLASPLGQNLALFDLDRVEILKGPQGTLFGRNATGGTLIFHTRQPARERSGRIATGAGSFQLKSLEGTFDTGEIGRFRNRLAGFARKSAGWTRDISTGTRKNDVDVAGGRLTIIADLSATWRVNALADFSADRSGMTAHSGLGLFEPAGLQVPPPGGPVIRPCSLTLVQAGKCANLLGYVYGKNPSVQAYDRADREYLDVGGLSVVLAHTGAIGFRSISTYRGAYRDIREDTDGSPLDLVALDFVNSSRAFTQEFLLNGDTGSLTWRAGAFFLDESLKTTNRYDTLGSLRKLGVGFIADANLFVFGPFRLNQAYAQQTRSGAVFADIDYAATPKFTVTAGARVTRESGDFVTQTRFNEVIANPVLSPKRDGAVTNQAVSWRLAARYAFATEQNAYASVSRGFKSGGFNGGALFASDEIGPLDPEFVTAFEAGVKWRFSPRLEVQGAVFHNTYSGLQDFTLRAVPPPTRQILDSADAQMNGADVTLRASLLYGFAVQASVALLDAKYVDFLDANKIDRSGNVLPAAPEVSSNFSLMWNGALSARLNASARLIVDGRSKIYFDNTNSPLLSSPNSQTLAASFRLQDNQSGWQLDVSGRNLLDERVVVAALNIGEYGFVQQTYAPPRSIQATIRKSF